MGTELEHRPGAPKPEYNPERRRLLGTLLTGGLIFGGGLLGIAGMEYTNRNLAEVKALETRIIEIYLQNEDPKKAMQTIEELKKEVSRRNYIRDRIEVWPVFGGSFLVVMGVFRLLKFM